MLYKAKYKKQRTKVSDKTINEYEGKQSNKCSPIPNFTHFRTEQW